MIITITNNRGGVGKSTTAQTLSVGLALKGYKVLLVDLDTQCNTSKTFNADDDVKNIYKVIRGEIDIKDAIQHLEYIDILSSSKGLIYADDEFKKGDYQFKFHKLVAEQLNKVKSAYNYIIIDTAPNVSLMTTNAIYSSDYVIIPMLADMYSIEGLQTIQEQIYDINRGTDNNRVKILGVLLTHYRGQTTLNQTIRDTLEVISKQINTKLFNNLIRDSIIFSDSQFNKSVCLLRYPTHNATLDYIGFINEVIKDTNGGKENE